MEKKRERQRVIQMTTDPRTTKPEALMWNAGGWFGTQIGGTCWIAICAALLSAQNLAVAGMVFAVFLSGNLVGTLIWRNRLRIKPIAGIQVLVMVIGLASLVATFVIDRSGLWHVVQGVGGTVSARQMYILIPVMIAGLVALFFSLNRSHASSGSAD